MVNVGISIDYVYQAVPDNVSLNNRHILIFVYAGELVVRQADKLITAHKGEYIFIKSNSDIELTKKSADGETFKGLIWGLDYPFLQDFYEKHRTKKWPPIYRNADRSVVKLNPSTYMESLYDSLKPYLDFRVKPVMQILEVKSQEAVYCLLYTDISLYPYIFESVYPQNNNLYN